MVRGGGTSGFPDGIGEWHHAQLSSAHPNWLGPASDARITQYQSCCDAGCTLARTSQPRISRSAGAAMQASMDVPCLCGNRTVLERSTYLEDVLHAGGGHRSGWLQR